MAPTNCFRAAVTVLAAIGPWLAAPLTAQSLDGITVTGQGRVIGRADVIEIRAMVEGEGELASEAITRYQQGRQRGIEAIQPLQMSNLKIDSGGVSINNASDQNMLMMMRGQQNPNVKHKVQIAEQLSISLEAPDEMTTDHLVKAVIVIIDAAKDAGLSLGPSAPNLWQVQQQLGNSQPLVTFKIKDTSGLRQRVYELAMQDARGKAKRLAELAGVQLGRVRDVTEGSLSSTASQPWTALAYRLGASGQGPPSDISSHGTDVPIHVQLTVQYEIQ